MNERNYFVVLVTAPSMSEAQRIADRIVEKKLAACVNIIDGCKSVFFWEGRIQKESEVLLIIKTSEKLFKSLEENITSLHSYDVPEIIALSSAGISDAYRLYLDAALKP